MYLTSLGKIWDILKSVGIVLHFKLDSWCVGVFDHPIDTLNLDVVGNDLLISECT